MKKFGILGLALTLLTLPALAGPGRDHHGPSFERIAEKLQLDSAQTEQFVTIMNEQRERRRAAGKALRDSGVERGSEEARAHREAMHAEQRAQLSAVLSAEQLDQLDTLREKHRARKKHRKMHHQMSDDNDSI